MSATKMKLIDKKSIPYSILKKYVCFAMTKIFYRRFTITSDTLLPDHVPVVFAANHQNALIDALAIICSSGRQPVFFARADIFKKKLLRKILTFLKIAPIFRIRDGWESMHQNFESFDLATGILSRGNTIGIFPEGTHSDREQLIPLKKGMARMVLQAEQQHDFKLNVNVVPVSIAYVDYIRPRTEVRVHFGKPLIFNELKEIYEENPSQALLKLNEQFEDALKSITIHVESKERYTLIQNMRKSLIYDKLGEGARLRDSFNAAHEFISKINILQKSQPDKAEQMFTVAENYFSELEANGISEPVLFKGGLSALTSSLILIMLLIGMPLHLAGRVLNYFPFLFFYRFVNRKIADTQFRSSVYFALTALVVAPFVYIIQAVIAGILFSSFWIALVSIPAMLLLGVIAYQYLRFWKWSMLRWKANIFVHRHREITTRLMKLRKEMLETLKEFQ